MTASLVSVVVPTIGSSGVVDGVERVFVESAVASVRATAGVAVELVLVCGPRTPPAVRQRLAAEGCTVVDIAGPFNFAASVNLGAAHAHADLVLFLNDDTEAVSDGWLRLMCDALEPGVGAVGARLLFEDGTLQHAGHTYRTSLEHVGFGLPGDSGGAHDLLYRRRRVAGVTAACLLTTMQALDSVGGFCTDLPANYNDVDLCMKLRALGYDIVYEPAAVLRHFESRSRVAGVTPDEIERIHARWFADLLVDPFSPVVG